MNSYVVHSLESPITARIDGKNYRIPPREVFEVEPHTSTDSHLTGSFRYTITSRDVCKDLLEKLQWAGLVEVPARKVKVGKNGYNIEFETDAALAQSEVKLKESETAALESYARTQLMRIQEGSPALPPVGRVAEIIKKHDIDVFSRYGINPVGYNAIEQANARKTAETDTAQKLAAMEAQIQKSEERATRADERAAKLEALLTKVVEKSEKK